MLVLPCAGGCGFPLRNEFFHLCCSERPKKKQPNGLVFFSLVSSLPMSMVHTHKRTKLQLVVGQPTALQLCASSVWTLNHHHLLLLLLLQFLFCLSFFPFPPKTHVRNMAANKIDTYFFGHAHTPTHTCLITKEKTKSTHSFIHSLNQGKKQKPGKQQQQHASYILLLERSSSAFATT